MRRGVKRRRERTLERATRPVRGRHRPMQEPVWKRRLAERMEAAEYSSTTVVSANEKASFLNAKSTPGIWQRGGTLAQNYNLEETPFCRNTTSMPPLCLLCGGSILLVGNRLPEMVLRLTRI